MFDLRNKGANKPLIKQDEEDSEKKLVHIKRIDRSKYPKISSFYIVILLFLGLLFIMAKILFK
jgi:hypothetical protein